VTEPDASGEDRALGRVPFERGGTYWIQRDLGFAKWDPVRSDWVNTKELPPAEPLDPSVEPEVDPWKETSVAEDAGEYFVRGPGRNLLIALGIFLAAMGAFWALSTVWDPFDVAHRGVFDAWTNALPFIAAIVAVIWFVVNGILRARRGEPFVPPRVRRQAEVQLRGLPRNLWRAGVMFTTVMAVVLFLAWWLGGYLKPFGASPIEFGPWENNPYMLTAFLISGGAAAVLWIIGWIRR
jgi:hypothetical protein